MPVNEEQIAWFAESYREVTGARPRRFVCPIKLEDDPDAELCDGHILCAGIKTARRDTVPQRKDVDNRFGTLFESDFVRFMNFSTQTAEELLQGTNSLEITSPDGEKMPAFFSRSKVEGRQRLDMYSNDGKVFAHPYLKTHSLADGDYKQLEVTFSQWFNRYASPAALLKTAYLTMFKFFGYSWVDDSLGDKVRRALRDSLTEPDRKAALRVFAPYERCAKEMYSDATNAVRGTLEDGTALCHFAEGDARSGVLFAITCLYWMNQRLIAVTLPSCNRQGFHFVAWNHYTTLACQEIWTHSVHVAQIRDGRVGIQDAPVSIGSVDKAGSVRASNLSMTVVTKA